MNNWLYKGRTATHVANKYHRTIYVRCETERQHFQLTVGANAKGVNAGISKDHQRNQIKAGFTKILPKHYVKFEPDCSGTGTVYITIYTLDDKGGQEFICDNLPKNEDMSVIVSEKGQVVDTKYGTVWVEK